MKPVSPVLPGHELPEVVYAKNQVPYKPLPVFRDQDGATLSRWRMSWRERLTALWRGDVYVWLLTFNQPLQPIKLQVSRPAVSQQ